MTLGQHSIRFRLTVWYAAVLTAGLVLFSILVWLTLRQQLIADLDHDLDGRAKRLELYFRNESAKVGVHLEDELEEFCQALPETSYVTLTSGNGFNFHFPDKDQSTVPSRVLQRQFVFNDQSYDLELGTPLEDVTYVLGRLRLLMFSLVPLVIAIACLGGAWMSRRALKPVQDVTAAAHSISIDNLSARLPVPKTGDEVARLTEVLNSMLARLDAAVQTLSQFAADASHELRTPLAVIRTTAELALRRGRTPESYRESLEAVVAEAEQMTELVEDLLMLARSDQAIAAIARTTVDLRVVLQDVCAQMEPLAEARDIRILRRFRAEDFTFVGSSPMLHRLFVLLIDNALKYSNPKGEIVVTLDQSGGDLCASVEDHGTGIAADDLEHIFKRFYRADKARSGGGHGLGLPLAQSIVQAHGARIEVISREGSGSIFRVVFPNVTPESARTIAGINGDAVPAA